MSSQKILFIIIFFFLVSCEPSVLKQPFKLEFTQKKIPLNGKGLETYPNQQFIILDNIPFLIGLNSVENRIDFFNLKEEKLSKSYTFEGEGPDGVGQPQRFYYHNQDSIFLYDGNFLIQVDKDKNIKYKFRLVNINSPENTNSSETDLISLPPYFPFVYQEDRKIIYYTKTRYIDESIHEMYNANTPIIGILNWQKKKVEDLPIYLPESLLSKDKYFGYLYHPQLTFWKDKLIVNYAYSSEVFVYDLSGKQMETYNLTSKYTNNKIVGLPIAEKNNISKVMNLSFKGPKFYPLHYDTNRKCFYRFHEVKELDVQGNMTKRDIYLMIMNENFEVLQEEKMPETINAPTHTFLHPEGLLVGVAGDQVREDHLTYNLIKLKN